MSTLQNFIDEQLEHQPIPHLGWLPQMLPYHPDIENHIEIENAEEQIADPDHIPFELDENKYEVDPVFADIPQRNRESVFSEMSYEPELRQSHFFPFHDAEEFTAFYVCCVEQVYLRFVNRFDDLFLNFFQISVAQSDLWLMTIRFPYQSKYVRQLCSSRLPLLRIQVFSLYLILIQIISNSSV